jgi:hypothetical protein
MRNALVWAIGSYVLAVAASYIAVLNLSSNRHDREVEAVMTSVFFFGPIAACTGLVIGYLRSR